MRFGLLAAVVAGMIFAGPLRASGDALELLDGSRPDFGWSFQNGAEFPGAGGMVARDSTVRRGGGDSLRLTGDFTKGGLYVAAETAVPDAAVEEISLWVRGLDSDSLTLRVTEASGRCHQFQLAARKTPDWQQLTLPLRQYFERQGRSDAVQGVLKYEAWGGGAESFNNDGSWKGPVRAFSIVMANPGRAPVTRSLWLSEVKLAPPATAALPLFSEDFEGADRPDSKWKAEGGVGVDTGTAFQGARSLVLTKTADNLREPARALGPSFPVASGVLDVSFAGRSDLTSMDNSYNASLVLEFFDAKGNPLGPVELGAWFRQTPWKQSAAKVAVPDGAVTARPVVSINKETPGKFWLDGLSISSRAGGGDDGLRRMMIGFSSLGHLLLPQDSRTATVEVWSAQELPEESRSVKLVVRDYWGAEQTSPESVPLKPAGKVPEKDLFRYEAPLDLSNSPLEIGRYYELHGEISRSSSEPFANYTAFAILPEAAANRYPPAEVPFTSRTWDQRFAESPLLTHRLGIRICNVWGRMRADSAALEAPQIDLVHELGMGVLTSSPAQGIEARSEGWEKLLAEDGKLIRQGVRNFFEKYGWIKPMIVNLGNEPHNKGNEVRRDVEAYRIIYDEVKKIDPSIYVVGTSVGLEEEYFKAGFGEWLDAYDFHSYEDPEGVRTILTEGYPAMFKKYGFAKPVWCTEIGMNSQGLTRQAVASLLYRKFANFFAGGGVNVSWFGLFYPDPDAKIHGSFAAAHNVFDCRYNKYAPKLDAIAYYNAVNSIAIKKFVVDKIYSDGSHLFLFRDRDNRSLVIAFRNRGRQDVFLPLPGVGSVEMIRLDGSRDALDAGGKGISLTVGEDPVLLLFDNGPALLPETLKTPRAAFSKLPPVVYRDVENALEVEIPGASPAEIHLEAPPFWKVSQATREGGEKFLVNVPAESQVREADFALRIGPKDGKPSGLLSVRLPVAGMVAMELLPVPSVSGKGAGVRLIVQNNSPRPQSFTWDVSISGEQTLNGGQFSEVVSSRAGFSVPASGSLTAASHAVAEVVLPMTGLKPLTVYHIKGTVRDESGRVVVQERPVAGFIPVPKSLGPVNVDGRLDEEAWSRAAAQKLDDASQFFGFKLSGRDAPVWAGAQDLSAEIRFLWDDRYLYAGITVRDDVAGPSAFEAAELWRQDGLQFLIDPMRRSKEKAGKYEYSTGLGSKGPQTWCTLSADPGAPVGDATDIRTAIRRDHKDSGDTTYELAIPWSRLAPFQPTPGNDLGLTLIVNEDDGAGRDAFMTWFGNAHSKDVDTVGDLILLP